MAVSATLKHPPPPQHLMPPPAPLLLLVSVTTAMQESSSGAQVCHFPLQLGPSLTHTSQLSEHPVVERVKVCGSQRPSPEGNGAAGAAKEEGQVSPWLSMGGTLAAEQGSV